MLGGDSFNVPPSCKIMLFKFLRVKIISNCESLFGKNLGYAKPVNLLNEKLNGTIYFVGCV